MKYQQLITCIVTLSCLSASVYAEASDTKALGDLYDVNPNTANCSEGTLKSTEKQKALNRLNMIRALSGLPTVVYDSASDVQTAKSALITTANAQLSHNPPSNWKCWTQDGYNGSNSGNIYIRWNNNDSVFNTSTEYFIDSWIVDYNVSSLGHRRWMLDPFLPKISFGRVDGLAQVQTSYSHVSGATLKVMYNESANLANSTLQYVAYPVGNYPTAVFNKNWYLSFSVLANKTNKYNNSNVSFANTTINVTGPTGAMAVSGKSYDNNGYGLPNNLQWKVAGLQDNVQYSVNISNVVVNGQTRSYPYTFKLVTSNSTTITAPTVTTNAASSIGLNAATLNGTVNDNGATTTVSFDFGTTTNYGTSIAAVPNSISAGSGNKTVIANKTGLACGTSYNYRVKAVNSAGTSYGSNQTFTTTACNGGGDTQLTSNVPVNDSVAANAWKYYYITVPTGTSSLTAKTTNATANIDLYVRQGSKPTTTAFNCAAYCPASGNETCPTINNPSAGTWWIGVKGVAASSYTVTVTLVGANTTVTAPTVTTNAASSIGLNAATLNGTVNDNGATTTVSFDFGTTTNYGTSIAAVPNSISAGSGNKTVIANKTGLACGTSYNYRVKAVNSAGTSYGSNKTFTTTACNGGGDTQLTSNVPVNDSVAANAWKYYYITVPTGTSSLTVKTTNATGDVDLYVRQGSKPTYSSYNCRPYIYYDGNETCTIANPAAENWWVGINGYEAGSYTVTATVTGGTTTVSAPTVTTNAASSIGLNAATLNGAVNDNGATTTVSFDFGTTTNYGTSIAAVPNSISAGSGNKTVTASKTGLACGTNYNYRVKAVNSVGTRYGSNKTFTTLSCGSSSNKPDLVVTNITLTPTTPVVNGTFNIAVTVKNQGAVSGGSSYNYLDVWTHSTTSQNCGAEGDLYTSIGTIAAGESKTFTIYNVVANTAGTKTLRTYVDSWCYVTESNETNNQLTTTYTVNN